MSTNQMTAELLDPSGVGALISLPTQPSVNYEIRPENLPPSLPGEELVEMALVKLVRDGSQPLEDEDALMEAIIDVWVSHTGVVNDKCYWEPGPVPAFGSPDYGSGHELMFMKEDGRPVAIRSLNVAYSGDMFTKEIPRRSWPPRGFPCPLSPECRKSGERFAMGFQPCYSGPVRHYAAWHEHLVRSTHDSHPDFISSVAMGGTDDHTIKQLWTEAQEDADHYKAQRRASDPRLQHQVEETMPVGNGEGFLGPAHLIQGQQ